MFKHHSCQYICLLEQRQMALYRQQWQDYIGKRRCICLEYINLNSKRLQQLHKRLHHQPLTLAMNNSNITSAITFSKESTIWAPDVPPHCTIGNNRLTTSHSNLFHSHWRVLYCFQKMSFIAKYATVFIRFIHIFDN